MDVPLFRDTHDLENVQVHDENSYPSDAQPSSGTYRWAGINLLTILVYLFGFHCWRVFTSYLQCITFTILDQRWAFKSLINRPGI